MHFHEYKFILYIYFGGFNITPNMLKMFPHISGPENIDFVKGWYWDLAIIIEAVLFNVYRWQLIPIHHTNPLVKLWQISSDWCKILDSIHLHTELQVHQKSWCNHWSDGSWSPYHIVMGLQWFVQLYFQNTYIYIVRTNSCLYSGHVC